MVKEEEREEKRKEEKSNSRKKRKRQKQDIEQVPNDYHPLSATYDSTDTEDALPICESEMK